MNLSELKNTSRNSPNVQRVGRGPGSGRGKTSCRGEKGAGSRSGWKSRFGKEGGQFPLYRKVPCRGFTRGLFKKFTLSINLEDIEKHFLDGEVVNIETLRSKRIAPRLVPGGLKILSKGELTKKVTIEAKRFSKQAIEKLEKNKIVYRVVTNG